MTWLIAELPLESYFARYYSTSRLVWEHLLQQSS